MSYTDRLNIASYESPSGASFSFSYRTVTRRISHRIGSFEFPGINGTLHQDKGVSGELYPMTIFIAGENYDLKADRFLTAFKEIGPGFLTHPRWGRRKVQITQCSQNEELTTAAGQAVFDITFQETLAREFPATEPSLQFEVPAQADSFQDDAITSYVGQITAEALEERKALKQEMLAGTARVEVALQDVASADQTVAAKFRGYIDDISNNIDEYVDEPFGYASSISSAIRVVAEVPGRVCSKLQGYSNLLAAIGLRSVTDTLRQTRNASLTDELIGTTAAVASAESVNITLGDTSTVTRGTNGKATVTVPATGEGFQTRAETLAAAILLRDQFTALIFALDAIQDFFKVVKLENSYIQVIESYAPTAEVVFNVINAALALSFSLPAERRKKITADTTIMNLCYEFYLNIDDDTLDYFILTNELDGAEILTIPAGREVVYYA